MKVTIADSLFMPRASAMTADVRPRVMEWERSEPWAARFVTESHIREAPGTGQVAWLLESFFLHPYNYVYLLESYFEHVLTSNRYFAENNEKWLWFPHGGTWIPQDLWGLHRKTDNVSMLLSDKKQMIGHRLRQAAAGALEKYIDVFYNVYPKYGSLFPYRYQVVIQSERCPGFFDEKIIDCFATGTIPIYWGAPDIGDYFNPDGIIQIHNLDELARLDFASLEDYYERNLDAVQANLENAREYVVVEDWLYDHYPFLFQERS